MNQLVISLTGKITETNFDEWKRDLLDQIDGIRKELKSDGDFVVATDQAKSLKHAEIALKEAKQSAIEQAADIQKLFAAIDEVSAAARKARLFLEGQIKSRKQEIKDDIVNVGVRKVRSLIEEQNDDFRLIDTRDYVSRGLFEDAIKGKRGIEGMESAVSLLIDQLRQDVAKRAAAVDGRAKKLASISTEYRALFQDRAALLDLADDALDATIAERIEVFNQHQATLATSPDVESTSVSAEPELFAETEKAGEPKVGYQITLRLLATKQQAVDLAREIREGYAEREIVEGVELKPGQE